MTRLLTLAFFVFSLTHLKADDAPPSSIKVTLRESLLIKGTFVNQLRNEGGIVLFVTVKLDRNDNSPGKTVHLLRVPFFIGGALKWVLLSGCVCLVIFTDNRMRSRRSFNARK
jgi:hypothetical protein